MGNKMIFLLIVHLSMISIKSFGNCSHKLGAEPPALTEPPGVAEYETMVKKIKSKKGKTSLEALYTLSEKVGDSLVRSASYECGDTRDYLESLDEKSLNNLRSRLEGMGLQADEIVVAAALPKYFRDLAESRGTPQDISFFKIYSETRSQDSIDPFYSEMVTDYSACTNYESKSFVKAYKSWRDFKKKYPMAYTIKVADELHNIEDVLTTNYGCACGKKASVIDTFEQVIKNFPDANISTVLVNRLQSLKAISGEGRKTNPNRSETVIEKDDWKFRFECSPG